MNTKIRPLAKVLHSRKSLLIVGIIFLFVLLGLEVMSRSTINVTVDQQGFHPSSVTIQPGQTIRWISNGTESHWPASNSHPTHTQYVTAKKGCFGSALDACRALLTDEMFEFTFNKTGSWGIHDHLMPGNVMAVNVAQVRSGWLGRLQLLGKQLFSRSKSLVSQLPEPEKFRSLPYDEQLIIIQNIAKDDPEAAWKYLKDSFTINGQVIGQFHEFGHIVGNAAYLKFGVPGLRICDATFGYGCFHGVTEKAILVQGKDGDPKAIEKECKLQENIVNRQNCFHGIGHGLASLQPSILLPALTSCEILDMQNRTFCYDGVMMEHVYSIKDQGVNADAPWKLCEDLPSQFHEACGNYQPVRLAAISWSYSQIIKSCELTNISVLKEKCYRAAGYTSVNSSWRTPQNIISDCSIATTDMGKNWCLMAASSEFAFQAYERWQDTVALLCGAVSDKKMHVQCVDEAKANAH